MGLIKNQNLQVQKIEEERPQEASALQLANARNKEPVIRPLYLLRVEDPTDRTHVSNYFCLKLREDSSILCSFVGFKAGKAQLNAFVSFEDVVNYVNKESVKIINIRVPWTRVINIENITYKHKKIGVNDE